MNRVCPLISVVAYPNSLLKSAADTFQTIQLPLTREGRHAALVFSYVPQFRSLEIFPETLPAPSYKCERVKQEMVNIQKCTSLMAEIC
jgi:hypothetical protein